MEQARLTNSTGLELPDLPHAFRIVGKAHVDHLRLMHASQLFRQSLQGHTQTRLTIQAASGVQQMKFSV